MSKYRSASVSTPLVLNRKGIRYAGHMSSMDQQSQDTVKEWTKYDPDEIFYKLSVTEYKDQVVISGHNVKFDEAYQFMFKCTGLFTQKTVEDLTVSPRYTIPSGTTISPLSLYVDPVDIEGNPNTVEKYKKLLREIMLSIRLLTGLGSTLERLETVKPPLTMHYFRLLVYIP